MALPENLTYSALKDSARKFASSVSGAVKSLPSKVVPPAAAAPSPVPKPSAGTYGPKLPSAPPKPSQAGSTVPKGTSLGTVTTPYGGRTRYEGFHQGIDLAADIGTPIPAFTGGTVTEVYTGGKPRSGKGFGNYVIVKDLEGNLHRYSHLNRAFVRVGQQVGRGTLLGGMGNTGAAYSTSGGTGSHLDYRVKNIYDKYVNPNRFMYGN